MGKINPYQISIKENINTVYTFGDMLGIFQILYWSNNSYESALLKVLESFLSALEMYWL